MNKRFVSVASTLVLLAALVLGSALDDAARANSNVLKVPEEYKAIQAAVNAANPGDVIRVAPGVYYEHVTIDKTLSLIGEAKEATIIDGNRTGAVVRITATNVNLSGFTIRRSGASSWTDSGILLEFGSADGNISNNIVMDNYQGIFFHASTGNVLSFNNISTNVGRSVILWSSSENLISRNDICRNDYDNGIELFDSMRNAITANTVLANGWAGMYLVESPNNRIAENTISNNAYVGIYLESSSNNVFYCNNLFHNGLNEQGQVHNLGSTNKWDNGAEGNYWSDYTGEDSNGDGIGDTNIPHLGLDSYPLIEPRSLLRTFTTHGEIVTILSESTIAGFRYDQILAEIGFNVTGSPGTLGYCNVTIPRNLLNASYPSIWTVALNGAYTPFASAENSTHTSLHFTYAHSTKRVRIKVAEIPNIPPQADFTYSPEEPTPYDTVNFTDMSIDSDGFLISWLWELGDGKSSNDRNLTHTYADAGTYIVTLKIKDNRETESITSRAISVRKVKTTLVVVSPSTIDWVAQVTIKVGVKDEKDDPVTNAAIGVYLLRERWEAVGSGKTNASGIAAISYSPLFELGAYRFKALYNGTEILAHSSTAFVLEILDVEPPRADAGADQTVYIGDTVGFDASGSEDNMGISSYDWDFGDGATEMGITVNHTFIIPGKYIVALTVKDIAGNSAIDSTIVTVLSKEDFPIWVVGLALGVLGGVFAAFILWKKRKLVREHYSILLRAAPILPLFVVFCAFVLSLKRSPRAHVDLGR